MKSKNMKTKLLTLLTLATICIAASAGASILYFGDPLVERTYASDYPVGQGDSANVMVIPSAVLPTGTLDGFATWDQVESGGVRFHQRQHANGVYLAPNRCSNQLPKCSTVDS